MLNLATLRIRVGGQVFRNDHPLMSQPLAPDITSPFLRDFFSKVSPAYYRGHERVDDHQYGEVVAVRVMLDDKGRSRGLGFISLSTPEMGESSAVPVTFLCALVYASKAVH